MILDEILQEKRREVTARRRSLPLPDLQARTEEALAAKEVNPRATPRSRPSLHDALAGAPGIGVIAEVKRASPSAGTLGGIPDPAALAHTYERAGADAISVLTDAKFFKGSLDDLKQVRRQVSVPVLRKDFIIDPYQVWESAWAGASAILLIVAALDDETLASLHALAHALNMEALVEAHTRVELERALALKDVRLVGINNRDLRTFETRLQTTVDLAPTVRGRGALLVSESGIHAGPDVQRVRAAGASAVLVGEALVRSGEPGRKIEALKRFAPRYRGGDAPASSDYVVGPQLAGVHPKGRETG